MPKTVTPADRRKNLVLDAASAASCAQALVDLLAVPGGIESADPDEVARLVKGAEAATCRIRRNFARVQAEAGAIQPTASQRVVIVGPNLRDQSKGNFHVHAEGCADLKRDPNLKHEDQSYVIEATSQVAVGDDIYADHVGEGSMDPGEGVHDCHFAPCVTLPRA